MKFRKKPVIIEAVQWNGIAFQIQNLPRWFAEAYSNQDINRRDEKLIIVTLEGTMIANPNDWIIRGVKGEIYPCKPEIFEATYEEVKE